MKLTLFAASGGIGRLVLAQALAAGHDVTAVARDPTKIPGNLRSVALDLAAPDPGALESALRGAQAVLSALGAASRSDLGVASTGTRAIVAAMRASSLRRIVVVSAAPVGTVPSPARPHPPRHDPGDGFVMRHLLSPLIKSLLREHYADLARMEDALRESGLDWTSVRPPRLTDKPRTGAYRIATGENVRGGRTISRADVADFMLRALEAPETVGKTMGIAD